MTCRIRKRLNGGSPARQDAPHTRPLLNFSQGGAGPCASRSRGSIGHRSLQAQVWPITDKIGESQKSENSISPVFSRLAKISTPPRTPQYDNQSGKRTSYFLKEYDDDHSNHRPARREPEE